MTREELDTMWQKAHDEAIPDPLTCAPVVIYHFAKLVAAAEREVMLQDGWRQCAVGQRTTQFCAMTEEAVKAEREACAKISENQLSNTAMLTSMPPLSDAAWRIRNAIRARGKV